MEKIRVGISGFGRIGRMVFRAIYERDDMEVVSINGLLDAASMVYLAKYDSTQGRFSGKLEYVDESTILLDGRTISITHADHPAKIEWKQEPEVIVEATGAFTRKTGPDGGYGDHLRGSVKSVILTAPAKDSIDKMVVVGVNDDIITPADHFISNASCTTNCLAPVVQVLHRELGLENGFMTTVHSYTNDQRVLDGRHNDMRRSRAAAVSQIPTTTGAAKSIGKIIPELQGKLDGVSVRVPTPVGSLVDFVCNVRKTATIEEINAMMKAESEKPRMRDVLAYTEDPLVSADIVHDPHSSIFDALSTKVIGNLVKVLAWYDNEWGYSHRVADLCRHAVDLQRAK